MKLQRTGNLGLMLLRDLVGSRAASLSPGEHLERAFRWLCHAQDATEDGGVSEGYHLHHGWLPSYPETTGYIVETFLDYRDRSGEEGVTERAIRMVDWLADIQREDGAIPDSYFRRYLVFDTGQVLFGFVRAHLETGEERYRAAAAAAAEWLRVQQGEDGAWERHAFGDIPHAYYSRVAWSMVYAHAILQDQAVVDAAARNIDWVLRQQRDNGWYDQAGFSAEGHRAPFTHTIAYTIRGVLEVGLLMDEARYVASAKRALDGFLDHVPLDAPVPGTLDGEWKSRDRYSCLTGNAQLAIALLRLYEHDGTERYLEAARSLNRFNMSRQELRSSAPTVNGAVAGSSPGWGGYIHFCYPNWAAKFFMDALMAEARVG
jgi:uncharacterized protein YyaL (SSP411 family)